MLFALVLFLGCTGGTVRRLQLEEMERQSGSAALLLLLMAATGTF